MSSQTLAADPRLSIVVPCYNEEVCLDELYRRISTAAREAVGEDYQIVLIDDGSRDGTWGLMRAHGEADSHVLALRLSRNHGQNLALSAGLDLCRGELVLIIDADLQDPPELLLPMIERLNAEDADVVYAVRTHRAGESWFKRASSSLFHRIISVISEGPQIPRDTGDFRLMSRRAVGVLQAMPEQSRFTRGMVAWVGFRQVPFRYERDARFAGKTKYSLLKMVRLALDAFTGFSAAPLRIASYAGAAFAFLSLVVLVYSLIRWLDGQTVAGWTSLIAIVLMIGAVQLFVLGMIGEYIARIYNQAKGRPLYIVSDVVGQGYASPKLGMVVTAADRTD
jgi:dolichol-phosphate mannosyltransferase